MGSRVAICLFESNIVDIKVSELMGGQLLRKTSLLTQDNDVELYVKQSNDSTPEWAYIVKNFSELKIEDTVTASSGAILFLKVNKRIMACCFGSTVANINRDHMVTDFGLAVAYKKIPKRNYKGIETYTLTENPITNNRSAAMPSTQNTFNLDDYIETITELSGRYFSSDKNILVKGKEFFSISAPEELKDIKELCKSLLDDYNLSVKDPSYKKLTAVSKVKTKSLIEFLNAKLSEALNKKQNTVYLVDYKHLENIDTYSLTPKGDKLTDIDITSLYNDVKKAQNFSMDYLKIRKISVYDSGGQLIEEWPLYKCLFFGLSINVGHFILYKGSWYEVQKGYLTDLKKFISEYEIDSTELNLPSWDGTQTEGDYNKLASSKISGQCWDKRLYRHPDFSYGIEFCDVLLSSHVIHVKKLASSSLNSHLLMQTYVSAQLIQIDPRIKNWIKTESRKHFAKNIFLKRNNDFKHQPVTYLITLMSGSSNKSLADSLPFFSLITFNMMIRKISQLGFDIKVCIV
jgi:uncharacterized protein (TIGR04141 family)